MLAEELDAPIQIHLHENEEVLTSVERSGLRPIDLLEQVGLWVRERSVHDGAW